jgi:Protein of unknown function (DUF4236)
MGLRFRRSIRLFPGLRINLGKKGASLSLGGRGATVNLSAKGTRTTVGLPGTGLSYSHYELRSSSALDTSASVPPESLPAPESPGLVGAFFRRIGSVMGLLWAVVLLVFRVAFLVFVAALVIALILSLFKR